MKWLNLNFLRSENSPWKRMAKAKSEGVSLSSVLGLVEGEILLYLEEHGFARLRKIVNVLEWPMPEVMMAIGALIQEGLVEVRRDRFGVILQPV